jgi:hypothetical protein
MVLFAILHGLIVLHAFQYTQLNNHAETTKNVMAKEKSASPGEITVCGIIKTVTSYH